MEKEERGRDRKKEKGKGLPSHTGRLSLNTVIFGNKHLKTDLSHCFPQVLHYHNGFSLQRGIKAWRHIPNSTQMQLVMHIIPAQHIRCHYQSWSRQHLDIICWSVLQGGGKWRKHTNNSGIGFFFFNQSLLMRLC